MQTKIVALGLSLALFACSSAQIQQEAQTADADISNVAQGLLAAVDAACADAAPVIAAAGLAAPANPTVASLVAYGRAICEANGEVTPNTAISPSTAAWIGGIKAGLQIAANLPGASAAAAAPAPLAGSVQ